MTWDTLCACGKWALPHSVMPMGNKGIAHRYVEDDIVPNTIVTLRCPLCDRGHSFLSPHEMKKVTE